MVMPDFFFLSSVSREAVETGVKLCEISSDVFTCVMFSGYASVPHD